MVGGTEEWRESEGSERVGLEIGDWGPWKGGVLWCVSTNSTSETRVDLGGGGGRLRRGEEVETRLWW